MITYVFLRVHVKYNVLTGLALNTTPNLSMSYL